MSNATAIRTTDLWLERLDALLGADGLRFDLYDGTIVDPSDTRQIFLSTDILRGIYAALAYEAGPAWRLVMRRCGGLWGQRLAKSLHRQAQLASVKRTSAYTMAQFASHLPRLIAASGWGRLRIDYTDAPAHGFVVAELRHSIFADALSHLRERVDYMFAGMLAGLFGELAKADLGCTELCSPGAGAESSVFVISSSDRCSHAEAMVEAGSGVEDILASLRG